MEHGLIGKQHDVAECMDNCMFQLETALLKFDGLSESRGESSDKTSVVKRYGLMIHHHARTLIAPSYQAFLWETSAAFDWPPAYSILCARKGGSLFAPSRKRDL